MSSPRLCDRIAVIKTVRCGLQKSSLHDSESSYQTWLNGILKIAIQKLPDASEVQCTMESTKLGTLLANLASTLEPPEILDM